MNIRDLEYILAVQQCGAVGKAAEQLGITQPSLSKAINRVESQLGVMLFERLSTGMRLTLAGETFLARAQRLSRDFDDALAEMRGIRSGEQGAVRLGYSPSLPEDLLIASCRRLLRERPAARLRLRRRLASELLEQLRSGELDVAVMPLSGGAEEFDTQVLYEDCLAVVADVRHPLAAREYVQFSDLQHEQWLLPEGHVSVRRALDSAFIRQGLPPPNLRIEADFSSEALYELIIGTPILTLARRGRMPHAVGVKPLSLDLDGLELHRSIGLVTRSGGYLSPVCERLLELFADVASERNMQEWL
ncbi:LysR family transcriptional regulator [Serratia marcescens]|jgi:Transcriptional regulator|uniref:LysR family transcriptional regulator n=1 Tax=Serratia TaxID=613 RepID=UPI00114E8EC3|nr:LysR family transcriptional regulator [Serratia marcescens]QDI18398.1 LysR family transcriptional regulator [Serratia marcescens]QDI28141.1 LysR family transcriptional regulator [Serratia marcescens]QDI42648.1 LysR family transcriptional regulator [Serratia marcescens]QDI57077.1 LysR family transcriptional regulator [Serratia marcescens]QLJ65630.1 LysR family transcriptional regulator [Serratia marcescens]